MALHHQQRRVTVELEQQRRSMVLESSMILNSVPWNPLSHHVPRHHVPRHQVPRHHFMRNTDGHFILGENNLHHHISENRSLQQHYSYQKIRIEEGREHATCAICLVEFCIADDAIRLPDPCGHVYHEDCIMRWLKRTNTCPLCRRHVM